MLNLRAKCLQQPSKGRKLEIDRMHLYRAEEEEGGTAVAHILTAGKGRRRQGLGAGVLTKTITSFHVYCSSNC